MKRSPFALRISDFKRLLNLTITRKDVDLFLFKISGATFDSVLRNEKHAFTNKPKDWAIGELVLVSKNKADCQFNEKQIQYTMQLQDIRPLKRGEADQYWQGTEGRWKYLFICEKTKAIKPFNLVDLLGDQSRVYSTIMTYKKVSPQHERVILNCLNRLSAFHDVRLSY